MTILHFAFILDNPCNGVCVAVPQHVRAQAQWADVGIVNIQGTVIPGLKEQLPYSEPFSLESLPGAFSRPDLVVFHEVYRPPFLSISRQLRKRGIPYIIVPHGCLRQEAQNQKWLKKRIGNMFLFNRFISGAVAIQCLSEQEMRETRKGRQKFLGTNGVAIPVRKKESFQHDAVQITYIGRLDVHTKGLDMLLNAAKEQADFLRGRGCRIQLYGPDYRGRFTQVENLIRENGIGDFVTLNREVSGLPKENALLDGDLFIQTSRHEGMPLGILEAMAYGIPCIVTDGTNLRGFIEEHNAGWGAENTAEAIAAAIVRAVEDRDAWEEKSRNARAAVRESFDWDVVAKETLSVYQVLVKESNND